MRSPKSGTRGLSELEGCVLGVIAGAGSATPYAVRRELRESPSSHWSASAGAVYPLVRRLEGARLIAADKAPLDSRGGRSYSLTPAGKRALRAWLVSGGPAGLPPDPLRTRVAFLGMLAPREARAFVTAALDHVRREQAALTSFAAASRGNCLDYFVARGAVLALRARAAWLREVQRAL